ncbi:hypothetical protein BC826DRAFT_250827 [Russula brevipes]|nr:hypothetical protein BC826DRAFT_250827 [Russula brevipes]
MVEHLVYIQKAWVQPPVWSTFHAIPLISSPILQAQKRSIHWQMNADVALSSLPSKGFHPIHTHRMLPGCPTHPLSFTSFPVKMPIIR